MTTSKTANTQSTNTSPWQPAQPELKKALTQIGTQPLTPSGFQTGAANAAVTAASNIPNFGPGVAGTVQNYLSPNFTDPYKNPALSSAFDALNQQISKSVMSQFQGAGRDPAGNAQAPQAIARGEGQAEAPILANEYNTLLGFQQNAPQIAGMIPGLSMQPSQAQLSAATQQAGLPLMNVLGAEQATLPIAGLGGQSTGYSTGSYTPSPYSVASNTFSTLFPYGFQYKSA
jgi:hypothetical protein